MTGRCSRPFSEPGQVNVKMAFGTPFLQEYCRRLLSEMLDQASEWLLIGVGRRGSTPSTIPGRARFDQGNNSEATYISIFQACLDHIHPRGRSVICRNRNAKLLTSAHMKRLKTVLDVVCHVLLDIIEFLLPPKALQAGHKTMTHGGYILFVDSREADPHVGK